MKNLLLSTSNKYRRQTMEFLWRQTMHVFIRYRVRCTEKIAFNERFLKMILKNLKTFWFHHLTKEWIFSKLTDTLVQLSLVRRTVVIWNRTPPVSSKAIELLKMEGTICYLKPVTRKKINAANFFMQGMFQEVPYNQRFSKIAMFVTCGFTFIV